LDEIILFRNGKEYKSYFNDVNKVDDAIRIGTELMEHYAKDFVIGDNESYDKINVWFRTQVMMS